MNFTLSTFCPEFVYLTEVEIRLESEAESGSDASWYLSIYPFGKGFDKHCKTFVLE